MGRGRLVFKGESGNPKKKAKKKTKHSKQKNDKAETTTAVVHQADTAHVKTAASTTAVSSSDQAIGPAPKIVSGTGRITTSGTVVTGHGTRFDRQLAVGDAIIVNLPGNQQEMRVVTMRLSNVSLNLSSAFSENLVSPTEFSYVNKPRDNAKEERTAQQKRAQTQREEKKLAVGTYGSSNADELVYREKTESGNYRIKRVKVDGGNSLSRGDLLEMRAQKKSDKYC